MQKNIWTFFLCVCMSICGFAQGSFTDPSGKTFQYNLKGAEEFSVPCYVDENGVQRKIGSGWISNAIKEQLRQDAELLKAAAEIVNQKLTKKVSGSGLVMYEIIQGAGYWLECPNGARGDMQLKCQLPEKVAYTLLVNTEEGSLAVAEIDRGKVIEIRDVFIGMKRFEQAEETDYESPKERGEIDCVEEESKIPPPPPVVEKPKTKAPIARIVASTLEGIAPLEVRFDGLASEDQDEEGQSIEGYSWNFGTRGAGPSTSTATFTFTQPGSYPVSLTVTDNEEETGTATINITVKEPPCFTDITEYTICKKKYGGVDTLFQTTSRVPCEGAKDKVVMSGCCCEPDVEKDTSRFQLAGGAVYIQNDGQLLEYALGVDIQIRYPFKKREYLMFVIDGTYFPNRIANPLDDRPHLWSELRDDPDPFTDLPLHWHRGTRRGTASGAIGLDLWPKKKRKWLPPGFYMQGLIGLERTFNQIEASDQFKDDSNVFTGFDLDVFFVEARVGVRKKHLEVYLGGRFLEESRPFTLVLANPLGGSHHRNFDNTIHAGVSVWY